jgi:hypothetical protein
MNSFLVNEVNDIGGRPERSEGVGFGKPPIHEILKKFCCFNNSFNSFLCFLCFRVFFYVLFQYVTEEKTKEKQKKTTFLMKKTTFLMKKTTFLMLY